MCHSFIEITGGVTLTPAGKLFYDGAKHLLSYSEFLIKQCQDTVSTESELRIGTSLEITSTFTYQISYEYKAAFPQTALNIIYTDPQHRFAELMNQKIDVCESFSIKTIKQYGLEFLPVLESQLYCIVSKNHPFTKKEIIYPSDLKGQTILISTSQTDCYGNIQLERSNSGAVYKRYYNIENKKLETALGHAIYFDYLLDPQNTDNLVAIPYEANSKYSFGFAYMPNPSPVVERFLKIVKKYKSRCWFPIFFINF